MLGVQAKVRQMGLWAPNAPVDCGGLGLSMVEHGLFSEALGRSPLGHGRSASQAPDAGNVEILHRHGTTEQRERWLRPLVAGEIRSCFSMTEPETPGSNPTMLATTAVDDGDDYVINGQKWFTSSADGAAFAIVMAVTDPDAPPHRRATMIIVPTDTPGFELVRNVSVMGHVGAGHDSHGEISYQSCRVPQANVLGADGDGFRIAQERLGPGRIHHCMRWLGIAARAFDLMCARANERVITPAARRSPTARSSSTGSPELDAEIRAARLLMLHAAWMIDRDGASAARDEISAIKFVVANTMLRDRRPGDPGARRARRHRRHDPRLLVPPRTRRPHLRRRRRGPQDHARTTDPGRRAHVSRGRLTGPFGELGDPGLDAIAEPLDLGHGVVVARDAEADLAVVGRIATPMRTPARAARTGGTRASPGRGRRAGLRPRNVRRDRVHAALGDPAKAAVADRSRGRRASAG